MNVELDLNENFRDAIEDGEIAAGAGIRYVVDDTYLDGSPTAYPIDDAVVYTVRRICEATIDVMEGSDADVHYLYSDHILHLNQAGASTVSVWTSGSNPVETDLKRLVHGVVVAAERLADYVVDVNPVLSNNSEIQNIRSAITRLNVMYQDEFGEVLRT
ncbi:hypothetical protein GJR96_02270 [Haloferax sp. MBLA0076]|uniref:Uncharacterized protein n=1 Tax=Haloferax litoreum TaxID=2666140 RepID=A0A6A8GD88_9EURY|nr:MULTISPECIES: hypothetical protein [Haloferax]KAB1192328.1 hypothetical protein Hfx1148_02255 [Haloferax sp. CBA1148]MRX20789.1 hypothetical protein [Haloferax litoreum]